MLNLMVLNGLLARGFLLGSDSPVQIEDMYSAQ